MREKVEELLNQCVRPKLAEHGGDVKVLAIEGSVLKVQMLGQCANCPSSYLTAEQLILADLQKELPELQQVLVECSVSDELLAQAKKLLGRHE